MSWLANKARLVYDYPTISKLHDAVKKQDLARVKDLLRRGVDPNTPLSDRYSTVLFTACLDGNMGIIRALDEAGQRYDGPFQKAIHAAITIGHIDVIRFLLEKGVPIDYKDEAGYTPLQSLLNELAELIQQDVNQVWPELRQTALFLIENGADVNAQAHGTHVLTDAISTWDVDIVKALVERGADLNIQDGGVTILEHAQANGTPAIVYYLNMKMGGGPINFSKVPHKGNLQVAPGTMNSIQLTNIKNGDEVYVLKNRKNSPAHIFLKDPFEYDSSTLEGWFKTREQQGLHYTVPATSEQVKGIDNIARYTARVKNKSNININGGNRKITRRKSHKKRTSSKSRHRRRHA